MKMKHEAIVWAREISSTNFDAGFHVTLPCFSTIYAVNLRIFIFTSGPLPVSVSCTKPDSCFVLYLSVLMIHETPVS